MGLSALYYYSVATTSNSCDPDLARDFCRSDQSWLCRDCKVRKQGSGVIDVYVDEADDVENEIAPLNYVYFGIGLIKETLIEAIGADVVNQHLWLGKIYGRDGAQVPNWWTFNGKWPIIVRGVERAGYRCCPTCHRPLYFAMGVRYLYPSPAADVDIFDGLDGGLVVTERIFKRIDTRSWRKLEIEKIPVVESPLDGLGELVCP